MGQDICRNMESPGKGMILSLRLTAVAGMADKGSVVCDVGCDHGFVPIYLVKNGVCPRVIAMDVNREPLETAREHIRNYALEDYIETRLSDGVSALSKGEADTLICAGMGGRLIKRILIQGGEKISSMKTLILQPQSELQGVREYLRQEGYLIVAEDMILEDGKYYSLLKVCPHPAEREVNAAKQTEKEKKKDGTEDRRRRVEDRYGPCLLNNCHPVLLQFLNRENRLYKEILDRMEDCGSRQEKRKKEIRDKVEEINFALSYYN